MYGKIFASMYEGSLYGHWQAIVTMQQLIVICDPDGIVDMTAPAISGRTSIPLEIIEKGLEELAKPDSHSRSDEEEGRRIVPVDPTRPWGWRIVNYVYYRDLVKAIDKREADRARIAAKRAESQPVAESRDPSQKVAKSRLSEAKTEAKREAEEQEGAIAPVGRGREAFDPSGIPGLNVAAWSRYLAYRSEIRKPYKPVSLPSAARDLASFGNDQAAVVEQCIAKGWTGLQPLKSKPREVSQWE